MNASEPAPELRKNKHERSYSSWRARLGRLFRPHRPDRPGAPDGRDDSGGLDPCSVGDAAAEQTCPATVPAPASEPARACDAERETAPPLWPAAGIGSLRLLAPAEGAAVSAHLLRLSADDRRLRFAHPAHDGFLDRYVRTIDWDRSFILAWEREGCPRAIAHVAWPDVSWLEGGADLGVSVEGPWQRQGVGRALVRASVTEARARNLPAIRWNALGENTGIIRLMRGLGLSILRSGTSIEGVIDLSAHDTAPRPGLRRSTRLKRAPEADNLTQAAERFDLTPKVPRFPG